MSRCDGRSIPGARPGIFRELGGQEQTQNVVLNAIRNGVRDGMVQYSINDIAQRNLSALITRPRASGEPFRIAQEQQIATERHRVEVARLQTSSSDC
jgi:hypothetical protein